MENSIVEIMEIQKTLMRFTDIPKGSVETAYVFFQSKDGSKFLITTEKKKIMAAELRSGKYDRIMKISRGHFLKNVRKEIPCKESRRYFLIDVSLDYYVKDPEYIYRNSLHQVGPILERSLGSMEFDLGDKYSFQDMPRMKQAIQEWLSVKLKKLTWLDLDYKLSVDVDKTAKELLERMDKNDVIRQQQDLAAIEEKEKIENDSELEQMQLERKKAVDFIQAEIEKAKIQRTGEILKQYGINGGNMLSYANGEISGTELAKRMADSRRQERQDMLDMLLQLHDKGLSTEALSSVVANSLFSSAQLGNEEPVKLEDRNEVKLEVHEQKVEGDEPVVDSFHWNDAKNEGDTIE